MDTRIISNPNDDELHMLARALQNGELVAIPTETVYGLGANGLNAEAVNNIYIAKGRPSDNPLILHVPDAKSIGRLVKAIPDTACKLMERFWPGPLTITLPKSDSVPDRVTGGLDRVALRCPDHEVCRALLQAAGVPVAAPSANISGRPSPTTAQDVYRDMKGRIPFILDAGPCTVGVESTVVEVHEDRLVILRPGGITKEMLESVVSEVAYDGAVLSEDEVPKAPGMKYKHYAPSAEMVTFVGPPERVADRILAYREGKTGTIGCLVSEETHSYLQNRLDAVYHIYGRHNDAVGLAHDLYRSLLNFDEQDVNFIAAEGVPREGLGVAVMNRMDKASGSKVFVIDEGNGAE